MGQGSSNFLQRAHDLVRGVWNLLSPELELAGGQSGIIHTRGPGYGLYTHTHTQSGEGWLERVLRTAAQSFLEE